jgi:hypothetical protein
LGEWLFQSAAIIAGKTITYSLRVKQQAMRLLRAAMLQAMDLLQESESMLEHSQVSSATLNAIR